MKEATDYGREATYKAERDAVAQLGTKKFDYSSITQINNVVKNIMSDERVMNIDPYPGEEVIVEGSCKRGANARFYQRRLRFGTMRDNFTVLHEVAHLLATNDLHGPDFRQIFCQLVEWFVDEEAGKKFRVYMGV